MSSMPQSTYAAHWFDGRNAADTDAEVAIAEGMLRARAGERQFEFSMADVRTSAAINGVPLRLCVPDGGVFVLADAAVDPQVLGVAAPQGFVHRLERNPVIVVLAVVAVIAFGVLAYRLAIPWLGGKIAERVPIEAEVTLGTAALASLDGFALGPTKLSAEQRAELQARFDRLAELAHLPREPQLVFRSSQRLFGANALALPGGTVLVTDQLVARAASPDEVAAVVAHEFGHIAHRHTMRRLLEQSASWLILGAVLNDVSGIGSLAAAAPALLIRLSFSRQDEEEADDYALTLLPQAGLSPSLLADSLEAISSPDCSKAEAATEDSAEKCTRGRLGRVALPPPAYLSTHPDIEARIAHARAAAH
jgi:Zn-dependent protease with chaperone function